MVIQCKDGMENSSNEECNLADENLKSESAASVLKALRKRNQQTSNNGVDTLEILRSNIQSYFNDKVNVVMKEFVKTFFEPAIKNIKDNTDETITDQQIQSICKKLLESCASQQYSKVEISSSPMSSSSRITSDINTSDSDNENGPTSLLQQALKRKRTESETEQLFKRQFFLTKTSTNYFGTPTNLGQTKAILKPTANGTVLTSSPKFVARPAGGILTSASGTSRPIFHIIQTPNNKNLVATHVELATLLQSNSNELKKTSIITTSASNQHVTSLSSDVVSSTTADSKVTSTQSDSDNSKKN